MDAVPAIGLARRSTALSRVPFPVLTAILAALLAVVQPLLAQAFGIVRWNQCYCRGGVDVWGVASTVVVWSTAMAVALGVVLSRRLTGRQDEPRPRQYVGAVVPATLGALLATPVVAAQARLATGSGVDHPGIDASLSVPIGVLIGVLAAFLALASTAAARGLTASWAWIWSVGLFGSLLLLSGPGATTQPLGGLDVWWQGHPAVTGLFDGIAHLLAVLGPAVVAGLVGFACVRRGSRVPAGVLGGVAGPMLVVAAYLSRGSALVGGNATWAWIAVMALAMSVVGGAVGAALAKTRGAKPS